MRPFPIWAGARQNLQSMLAEFFWRFSSTRRLFVQFLAVACSSPVRRHQMAAFFLREFFPESQIRDIGALLFPAGNLSPLYNHP